MALEQANLTDPNAPTVVSPLSYLQVGQQLFNRELAQPEISYLQSLYGQDVDPTEMGALQKALAPSKPIEGLYESVLGRGSDPFGRMYWSQAFGSEVSPEEEAAFRQAAAPEIAARPTSLDQIKGLYTEVLGREADQPGLDYWANQFGAEVSPEERAAFQLAAAPEIASRQLASTSTGSANVAPDLFQNLMPLINARFQEYGRTPTPEDIANLRSQAEALGLNLSDPNLGLTSQYQSWANYVANAAKPKPQPWWAGQFGSEADANFVDTNRNQQIEETERAAWRSQYDPNSTEYQQRVAYESTIKNEFDAIYDDQTLTGPQKAIKVQQLANTKNYSNADLAKALGVTEEVLGTFLNQEQPNWEQVEVQTAGGDYRELYVNPVTGEKVDHATYMQTANTPDAIAFRVADAPRQNFIKNSGLGADAAYKVWNTTDTYSSPVNNKDQTTEVRNYIAKQLTERGITDFGQIEERIIKGDPAKVELGPTEYLFEMPTSEWSTGLFRSGPDGYEAINPDQYEIGQRQAGEGGYTIVAVRRKNVIPGTPDITKYFNASTGKEIDNVLFDDKAGTKYIVTSNGIQKQLDPKARDATSGEKYIFTANGNLESVPWWYGFGTEADARYYKSQDISKLASTARAAANANDSARVGDRGGIMFARDAAFAYEALQRQGVKNFADLMWAVDDNDKLVLFDKGQGKLIDSSLGGVNKDVGRYDLYLTPGSDGSVQVSSTNIDPYKPWYKDVLPAVAVLAAIYAPQLLSYLGGSGTAAGTAAASLGSEAALLAAEGLSATQLGGAALTSELGGLAILGEGAGAAAAASSGGFGSALLSELPSLLPVELVDAGKTLYSAYNTVKGPLQLANSVYQLSQGNLENALLSTIDAASIFGVDGAKEISQILNLGLAASKGNYLPVLQTLLSQTNVGSELASTKIGDTNFTVGDAINGVKFGQAVSTGDITQILNASTLLSDSQDLKVAAAANNFINILKNPRATAFDIAMGAERIAQTLNTASKQPPKGALPTSGQSTVTGALGNDTVSGALGNDVIDEYNVTGGAGTQITGNIGADVFIAAKNAGATDSEALDAANGVTVGTVKPSNVVSRDTSYDPDLVDATAGQTLATKIADAKEAIRMGAGESTGTAEITAGAGEFTGADTAQATNEKISGAKTFGEAYSEARKAFGAGATFNWQGKLYSTDTFQENPALGLVPVAGSGRGEAAGKTAEQEAALENTRQMLLQQRNAPTNVESSGFWGNLSKALSDQMKLSSDAANAYLKNNPDSPITQAVSTGVEAAGNLQKNIIGGTALLLDNKPVADAFIKGGDELIKLGQSIGTGPQDTKNWKDTLDLIDKATGLEKIGVLAGRVFDGTSGLGRQTILEIRQEFPALFLGGGTARGVLIASGLIDTKDTMGGAAIDAYDDAIKTGKSHNEALSDARMAGMAAGATEAALQLTLGKLGDLALGKLDNVVAKGAGRIGGEGITEGAQEGGSSLAQDLALGRDLDLNKALTQTIVGSALGKSTSATTSPVSAAQDLGISDEVSNSITNIQSIYGNQKTSTAIESLVGSTNLSGDSQLLTNELSNLMGESAAVITVNNLAGAVALQKASQYLEGVTLNDASAIVGTSPSGSEITVLNAIGSQVTGNGTGVPLDTQIGTRADGSAVTLGDIRQVVNPSLASQVTQLPGGQTVGSEASGSKLPADANKTSDGTGPVVGTGPSIDTGPATDVGLQFADQGGYTGPSIGAGPSVDAGPSIGAGPSVGAGAAIDSGPSIATGPATDMGLQFVDQGGYTGPAIGARPSVDTGPATGTGPATDLGLQFVDQGGYTGPTISTGPSVTTGPAISTGPSVDTGPATDMGLQFVDEGGYTGSNTGAPSVIKSDGNSNIKVEQDGDNLIQTKTDLKTGDTTQVIQNPNGTETITKKQDGGSVVNVNQDGSISSTEIKGDVVVNTDGNLTTTLNTQTNTFVVVNQGNETVGGGNIQNLDPKIISDVIKINDLNPVVTTAPPEVKQPEVTKPAPKTPVTKPPATAPKSSFGLPAAGAALFLPQTRSDYELGMLKSSGDTRIKNPLEALVERVEEMNQIDPALMAVMAQRMNIQPPQAPTYTYGEESAIEDILGLRQPKPQVEEPLYAEGGYVEPLRAKGGAMNLQFMNRGGALPGGREDFKGGKHVAGEGDGQSDDIPAWLADGEFVVPADVVSALGNGSTKAGTDKLYKMMHEIRARARSTKVKDLPPPAHKSPLDYIRKGK